MKLLFEINETGKETLKEVLGFVDADLEIADLKSEVEHATSDLIKIIGKQTYEFIYDQYKSEDVPAEEFADLILKAQGAVGTQAYRHYAPKSDLAVTNQGRQMRMDEHHKQPFEWMVDRHNKSLEKDYYKKLDNLIEYLDELNPVVKAAAGGVPAVKWKDTENYKNTHDILFRTTDEFDEYFVIESRYLLMKLAPGIKKIKRDKIIPRMGKEAFEELMSEYKSGSEEINSEILQTIKEACAYLSLSWAVRRMSAILFPEGVLQNYISERNTNQARKVPEKNEIGVLSLLFEEDGERALLRLEELLQPVPEVPADEPLYKLDIRSDDKFVST